MSSATAEPTPDEAAFYEALPLPFGESASIEMLGGVAAPLLAGFSFALIGVVVADGDKVKLPDHALVGLVIAALLLVAAVQCGQTARRWALTPSERAEWLALAPEDVRPGLQLAQVKALRKHKQWIGRTQVTFKTGIVVLLAAVAVTLIPKDTPPHETWRTVAVVIAFAGALAQAVSAIYAAQRAWRWDKEVRQIEAQEAARPADKAG